MSPVSVFEMIASLVVLVAAPVLLVRALSNSIDDGPSLSRLFAVPLDPPWPRGVQEEEPAPWQMERLRFAGQPGAVERVRAAGSELSIESPGCV